MKKLLLIIASLGLWACSSTPDRQPASWGSIGQSQDTTDYKKKNCIPEQDYDRADVLLRTYKDLIHKKIIFKDQNDYFRHGKKISHKSMNFTPIDYSKTADGSSKNRKINMKALCSLRIKSSRPDFHVGLPKKVLDFHHERMGANLDLTMKLENDLTLHCRFVADKEGVGGHITNAELDQVFRTTNIAHYLDQIYGFCVPQVKMIELEDQDPVTTSS